MGTKPPTTGEPFAFGFGFEDKLRIFAFAAGCVLLTLRLDGWKAGNLDTLIQIGLIPYSFLFIFCVVVFLWPGPGLRRGWNAGCQACPPGYKP